MPALTIPSPTTTRPASPADPAAPSDKHDKHDKHDKPDKQEKHDAERSRSQSPGRPPVSPITPTVSVAHLAPVEPAESQKHVLPPPLTSTFIPKPPSVPISESENPDAIALRSAISLLQLQREKSKRDLKALEDLKTAAVSDPQAFVRSLQEQRTKASTSKSNFDALAPTLADVASPSSSAADDEDERKASGRKDSGSVDSPSDETPLSKKFPQAPQPQNIIRCPPVNWAKYHIVGEPLDKMHQEQKKWPGSSEPPRTGSGARAPPHAVAAPYSPFTDGVSEAQPTHTSRGTKKSPSR